MTNEALIQKYQDIVDELTIWLNSPNGGISLVSAEPLYDMWRERRQAYTAMIEDLKSVRKTLTRQQAIEIIKEWADLFKDVATSHSSNPKKRGEIIDSELKEIVGLLEH